MYKRANAVRASKAHGMVLFLNEATCLHFCVCFAYEGNARVLNELLDGLSFSLSFSLSRPYSFSLTQSVFLSLTCFLCAVVFLITVSIEGVSLEFVGW